MAVEVTQCHRKRQLFDMSYFLLVVCGENFSILYPSGAAAAPASLQVASSGGGVGALKRPTNGGKGQGRIKALKGS